MLEKESKVVKLVFFVPESHKELVKSALFEIGVGRIGSYDQCSFEVEGVGQYRALDGADPFIGKIRKLEKVREYRIEMVMEKSLVSEAKIKLLEVHPYETPAYEFYAIIDM